MGQNVAQLIKKKDGTKIEIVEIDFLIKAYRVSRLRHITNDVIKRRMSTQEMITDIRDIKQLIMIGTCIRNKNRQHLYYKRIHNYNRQNKG